jgi:iron complex transport system substrate-binding protein
VSAAAFYTICKTKDMRKGALVMCALGALVLSGCARSAGEVRTIAVTDVSTSRVSLDEKAGKSRVIALANGSAEIIDALGFKGILVGRDIASTDPSLESVPIVTSGHQVVAEKIIALNPDLVIIDASVGPSQAIEALRAAKIEIVAIDEVWDVEGITGKIKSVATTIGAPLSGEALVAKMVRSLAPLTAINRSSATVAFLYLRGGNSIYLLGGKGSGADSIISSIGATDVGSQISSKPFTALTSESFASVNPQILLVMSKGLESVGGVDGLLALPGVAQTDAAKNRAVIAVDDSLLLSFGPRTPSLLTLLDKAVSEVKK